MNITIENKKIIQPTLPFNISIVIIKVIINILLVMNHKLPTLIIFKLKQFKLLN